MTKKIQLNPLRLRDEMVVAAVEVTGNKHEVARKFDISRSTVYGILQRVKRDSPLISNFKAVRAEINTLNQIKRQEKQDQVLDSIMEEDIRGANLQTKMEILNTLGLDKKREYEMERLERGESTENVAVIVAAIKELKRKRSTSSQ